MTDPTAILIITGPTAGGKERLAVEAAARIGGEILSADSMKVYRGMDIGTAKASPDQRGRVPHHLLDLADPAETFSAARWLRAAEAVIAQCAARGRVPVVSGGTPLYLKALLEGLFEGPAADPALRARLHAEAQTLGSPALHERLAQIDPAAAARIHPNDLRRITRALEVWQATGHTITDLQRQWGEMRADLRPLIIGLRRDGEDLTRRIAARVRRMLDDGLVDEVRRLDARPEGLARGPRQALGYAEVLEMLAGRLAEADLEAAIVAHTRQFARRQRSWLGRFEGVRWLDAAPDASTEALADAVVGLWREHTA
jgi:tRNA dimethylallyltransferase